MLKLKQKDYDFVFVLPRFALIPPGGYMVVFELSKHLIEKRYTVLIIFLKETYKNLYSIIKDQKILKTVEESDLKFRIFDKFQNTTFINLLIKMTIKYPLFLDLFVFKTNRSTTENKTENLLSEFNFDNINFIVSSNIPKKIKTRRIVATAWETSYFTNLYQECKLKYYLVQHNEDDPSFSGQLSTLAKRSYDLNLKKIVINKRMQKRFDSENPIKIDVAPHVRGKILVKPEERNNKIILIQLREGSDKGAEYAIQAVSLIKFKHPEVDIISFGYYKKKLPNFITHLGYVDNSKYVEIMNLASVFVLPSIVEGFSTPVLEAMSCGCVPVATMCGGPEDFVEHQINGLLVPIRSSADIAESVIWLLNHVKERIEMAYKAIDTSLNYSTDRMGDEFIKGISMYEEKTGNF